LFLLIATPAFAGALVPLLSDQDFLDWAGVGVDVEKKWLSSLRQSVKKEATS